MEAKALAVQICDILYQKKANNILKIHVEEQTIIADYFIIASGNTVSQVKALCDELEEKLASKDIHPTRIDGYNEGRWVVLDFSSILVHIFKDEDRLFYQLERLWSNYNNTQKYDPEAEEKNN